MLLVILMPGAFENELVLSRSVLQRHIYDTYYRIFMYRHFEEDYLLAVYHFQTWSGYIAHLIDVQVCSLYHLPSYYSHRDNTALINYQSLPAYRYLD